MAENVNHPEHYGGADNPYEVIKVIEAWDLNFRLGNTIKYIPRAGKKPHPGQSIEEKTLEDLKKARWYLNREIQRLESKLVPTKVEVNINAEVKIPPKEDVWKSPRQIITLCGSTRFKKEFELVNRRLTEEGYLVLSVGSFPHVEGITYSEVEKENLDKLHKRKIDVSDAIMVLDVNGYIGDSTRSEIAYARDNGKVVKYLSDFPDLKFLSDGVRAVIKSTDITIEDIQKLKHLFFKFGRMRRNFQYSKNEEKAFKDFVGRIAQGEIPLEDEQD